MGFGMEGVADPFLEKARPHKQFLDKSCFCGTEFKCERVSFDCFTSVPDVITWARKQIHSFSLVQVLVC